MAEPTPPMTALDGPSGAPEPPPDNEPDDERRPTLEELGLAAGDPVRWRRQAGARWTMGTVIRREADGSVAVRDQSTGAWRSIPVERLEAQGVTKRGTKRWETLADHAREHAPEPMTGNRPQMKLW